MAELIQKQDTLNEGRVKINAAITDAEQAKVTADGADTKATQALANSESTQTQLDTIVINGDSSVEAAQARVDEKGVGHTTLKDRIDDGFTKVASQLNDKANSQFESVIIKVPSDFSNISEAISKMSEFKVKRGVVIEVLIESEYKPTTPIKLYDGDFSHFRISSEDEEVFLSSEFPNDSFLIGVNAQMPIINTLFNGGGYCSYGIAVHHISKIKINEGCGFKHAGRDNLVARYGGIAVANYGVFTHGSQDNVDPTLGDTYAGITAWGGVIYAHGADASHSLKYGARAAHGGVLHFRDGISKNCGSHGIRASNAGTVDCRGANMDDAGNYGIYALAGSTINAYDASALNAVNGGVVASQNSRIDARNVDVSGSLIGVEARMGSTINFTEGVAREIAGDFCIQATQASTINANLSRISGGYDGIVSDLGSVINCNGAQVNRAIKRGLRAENNSAINASNSNIQFTGKSGDNNAFGIYSISGSRINVGGANVVQSSGNDLRVNNYGVITANKCKTTKSTSDTPHLDDVNVVNFNTFARIGMVFN